MSAIQHIGKAGRRKLLRFPKRGILLPAALLSLLLTLNLHAQDAVRYERTEEQRKPAEKNISPAEKRERMEIISKQRSKPSDQREARREEALRLYDRRNAGQLSKTEVRDMARDSLLRWDLNGDGRIDQYEFRNMQRVVKTERIKDAPKEIGKTKQTHTTQSDEKHQKEEKE